jgi:hypothetical protein
MFPDILVPNVRAREARGRRFTLPRLYIMSTPNFGVLGANRNLFLGIGIYSYPLKRVYPAPWGQRLT